MKISTVDAFTDKLFSGNPAGVCITDRPLDESLMQNIAAELNLAETAFVVKDPPSLPEGIRGKSWGLRWFTPNTEIALCGHATLSAAHILYESGTVNPSRGISFMTMSGELTACKREDLIELDFPAARIIPADLPEGAAELIGTRPIGFYRSLEWDLAELDSPASVRELAPDLRGLDQLGIGRLIVTARSDMRDVDFISRVFPFDVGIDEDPVTGAAHCLLAPLWSAKLGKKILQAYQASKRGGLLEVEDCGNRVLLRGKAVTVMTAELHVQAN